MEKGREGDAITLYALRQINCIIPSHIQSIGQLTAEILVSIVDNCLKLISGGTLQFQIPLPKNIATKHRICTEMASKIKSYGYLGDCGYNQLLYPVESQTRSLLIWLIQKLPPPVSSRKKTTGNDVENDNEEIQDDDDDDDDDDLIDDQRYIKSRNNKKMNKYTQKKEHGLRMNSNTLHHILSTWKSKPWKLPFSATSTLVIDDTSILGNNTTKSSSSSSSSSSTVVVSSRKEKLKQENDLIIQSLLLLHPQQQQQSLPSQSQDNHNDRSNYNSGNSDHETNRLSACAYSIFVQTLSQQSKNIYFHRAYRTLLGYDRLSVLDIFAMCKHKSRHCDNTNDSNNNSCSSNSDSDINNCNNDSSSNISNYNINNNKSNNSNSSSSSNSNNSNNNNDSNNSSNTIHYTIEHTLFEMNALLLLNENKFTHNVPVVGLPVNTTRSSSHDGRSICSNNYYYSSGYHSHNNGHNSDRSKSGDSSNSSYISPSVLYTKSFNAMIQSLAVAAAGNHGNQGVNNSSSSSSSSSSMMMMRRRSREVADHSYVSVTHDYHGHHRSSGFLSSSSSSSSSQVQEINDDSSSSGSETITSTAVTSEDVNSISSMNKQQHNDDDDDENQRQQQQQEQEQQRQREQQLISLESAMNELSIQITTQQTHLQLLTANLLLYEKEYLEKVQLAKSLNHENVALLSLIDDMEKKILLKKELLIQLPTAQSSIHQLQLDCHQLSILLLQFTQQFELLRIPIITEIRQIKYDKRLKERRMKMKMDTITQRKVEIAAMKEDMKKKEILIAKQIGELKALKNHSHADDDDDADDKASSSRGGVVMKRYAYTDRILEITHSIAKQNQEIDRIVSDIHRVQKAISHTTLVLQRADTVAEELIYGATNAASSSSSSSSSSWPSLTYSSSNTNATSEKSTLIFIYKQLTTLRQQFDSLFTSIDKFAQYDKLARDMETKIDQERQRFSDISSTNMNINSSNSTNLTAAYNLNKLRLQTDLKLVQLENQELLKQIQVIESNGSDNSHSSHNNGSSSSGSSHNNGSSNSNNNI